MKAFAIASRDTQPTVQDLPNPQPAPGEVLVQVEAASVNGFDLSVAAGYVWDMIPHEFPVVLGRDLVGLVTAVGDGVEDFAVGDRVARRHSRYGARAAPPRSPSPSRFRPARSPAFQPLSTPSRRPSSASPA